MTYDELDKFFDDANNESMFFELWSLLDEPDLEKAYSYVQSKTGCDKESAQQFVEKVLIEINTCRNKKQLQPAPTPSSTKPTPKYPTCQSVNIKKISGTSRWLSVGVFGLASNKIGKTFKCSNCGYMW